MRWTMLFAAIVAAGTLSASAARAQDETATATATATATHTATPDAGTGTDVDEQTTVDANGMPVAKPNPMSDFLKRSRQQGTTAVEMPLVDDPWADGPATGGQRTE